MLVLLQFIGAVALLILVHELGHFFAAKAMGIEASRIVWDDRIYDGSLEDLLAVLESCPERADIVMLVGHNPGLEDLLEYLCSPAVPPDGKLLPTATAAVVSVEAPWSNARSATATLQTIQRPRELESG